MPHDIDGRELKVGDRVLVECVVKCVTVDDNLLQRDPGDGAAHAAVHYPDIDHAQHQASPVGRVIFGAKRSRNMIKAWLKKAWAWLKSLLGLGESEVKKIEGDAKAAEQAVADETKKIVG